MVRNNRFSIKRGYQVTIPKELRKLFNLGIGDEILYKVEGDQIILTPVTLECKPRKANKQYELLPKSEGNGQ